MVDKVEFYFKEEKENKLNLINCSECDAKFFQQTHLDCHMKRHKLVKCPYCEQGIASSKIVSHRRSKRCLYCKQCKFTATSYEDMKIHKEGHPAEAQGYKRKVFYCNLCDWKTPSGKRDRLVNHLKRRHAGKYNCEDCSEKFDIIEPYKKHMKIIHGKSIKPRTKKYLCKECSYESFFGSNLSRHIKSVHTKTYTCHYCGDIFDEIELKINHLKDAHKKTLTAEYAISRREKENKKRAEIFIYFDQ